MFAFAALLACAVGVAPVAGCASTPGAPPPVDERYARTMRVGDRAYAEHRYAQAAGAYERGARRADALMLREQQIRARAAHAAALIRQGLLDQAGAPIEEARWLVETGDPDAIDPALALDVALLGGVRHLERGDAQAARDALDSAAPRPDEPGRRR